MPEPTKTLLRCAQALRDCRNLPGVGDPGPWDQAPERSRQQYLTEAEAVLAAATPEGPFIDDDLAEQMWQHVGQFEGVEPEDVIAVALRLLAFPRLGEVVTQAAVLDAAKRQAETCDACGGPGGVDYTGDGPICDGCIAANERAAGREADR